MERRIKGRRGGSDSTVELYLVGVRDYLRSVNLEYEPDKAIELMKQGKIDPTITIDEWIDQVLERCSSGTVRKYIDGVKRWLTANRIKVEWDSIEKPKYEATEIDRAPTTEELQKILLHTYTLRDKSIILCAKSSGLRIGTLLGLNFSDLDFNSFEDVVTVTVRGEKGRKIGKNEVYLTFFDQEAKQMLLQYVEKRKHQGETITKDTPLFPAGTDSQKNLHPNVFRIQWHRILERAGLGHKTKTGSWHELHFHTLRKFFDTKCKNAGIHPSYIQHWMTHKGGKSLDTYLDSSYFKPLLEDHIERYRKVIPHLTIRTEIGNERIKKLEQKLEKARKEIQKLQENNKELRELADLLKERDVFKLLRDAAKWAPKREES